MFAFVTATFVWPSQKHEKNVEFWAKLVFFFQALASTRHMTFGSAWKITSARPIWRLLSPLVLHQHHFNSGFSKAKNVWWTIVPAHTIPVQKLSIDFPIIIFNSNWSSITKSTSLFEFLLSNVLYKWIGKKRSNAIYALNPFSHCIWCRSCECSP